MHGCRPLRDNENAGQGERYRDVETRAEIDRSRASVDGRTGVQLVRPRIVWVGTFLPC